MMGAMENGEEHESIDRFSVVQIDLNHFIRRRIGYIIYSRWEMIKQYRSFSIAALISVVSLIYYLLDGPGAIWVFLFCFSLFFLSMIIILIQDSMTALHKRFDWNSIINYALNGTDSIKHYNLSLFSSLKSIQEKLAEPYDYQLSSRQKKQQNLYKFVGATGFAIGVILLIISGYILVIGEENFLRTLTIYSAVATVSILTLMFAMWCFVQSVRIVQPTAAQILNADPRKPILFLRSFADDKKLVRQCVPFMNSRQLPAISLKLRFEEAFSDLTNEFGPTVALGDPNEKRAQLGAARDFFMDDNWKQRIFVWLANSSFIFLIAGRTFWVKWELESIIDNNQLEKLIVLFPPKDRNIFGKMGETDRQNRWNSFVDCFSNTSWYQVLKNQDSTRALIGYFHHNQFIMITSDQDWENDYKLAIIVALYGMNFHKQ